MNNCFDYSFIKCGTAPSDVRTLDGVFNTLSKMDLYSMFDKPQEAIDRATELAYNSMTSALISKEDKSINKYNQVLCESFTNTYSDIQTFEFSAKNKQFYRLNKFYINVEFDGKIKIILKNELAQETIVSELVASGVTTEIVLGIDYKYVEISVEQDIKGRTTYKCGMNGILIDYSVLCDYNTFICSNKDLFQVAMDYKVASILLTDGLFSGEVGQRMMQSEDYDNLKKEYEIQYELELDKLSIKESGCFECGSRIQAKSWLS